MAVQPSKDILRDQFVGKTLNDVVTPQVVLDLAKVEANCNLMLEAAERLQLSWRAHIKTHKTEELTRLQVGDKSSSPVNLIVSTIIEAEKLIPLLKEYQQNGRKVNVLYSFPLYQSCIPRLAAVSAALGAGALSVMVDHVDQVPYLSTLTTSGGHPPLVFLKVDVGGHRAGVIPDTPACSALISALLASETAGTSILLGVYSHAGHSYASRKDWEAMNYLSQEFEGLRRVAEQVKEKRAPGRDPLVLSVGATPTATTIQHPDLVETNGVTTNGTATNGTPATNGTSHPNILTPVPTTHLKSLLKSLKTSNFTLEVHAGVYPTLDIQQLCAHARDSASLNASYIGITVLAEICSLYPSRSPNSSTEALVNAGCIAIGREPVADLGAVKGESYVGWGVLMPWGELSGLPAPGREFPTKHEGWEVASLSQEHGILRWAGKAEDEVALRVGQRVRVWPNHSCITGAAHAYYLVVDSRNQGREDEIVDVWVRWNGW
ncbi:putative serine dehydratase domain-containing protein [Annulohypoxylon maeteangense]|uniref:putative serine dehydratase domain-containing protein n=1 Tax=Annulohypoxylon maeteangense TaxID=1927788 RepID=UPI00200867C5|nr:putative serine dehydratase domain-containing protein [Annulohypoxylon maeteangense]KAI0881459.1 putative serine dehydratase domain-containing protein [Annulohypoxylon maeteangense]